MVLFIGGKVEIEYVDITRIQEISMDDIKFEQELIEEYISSSKRYLDDILKCLNSGDTELLTRSAHSLKGSSANMGAEIVKEISFEIERMAKSGNLNEAPKLLEKLKKEFQKTEDVFKEYLNKTFD